MNGLGGLLRVGFCEPRWFMCIDIADSRVEDQMSGRNRHLAAAFAESAE